MCVLICVNLRRECSVEVMMSESIVDTYNGWEIRVVAESNQCANFSFTVTAPDGKVQEVKMGGENEARALERAREMIDAEIAFAGEE